MVGFQHPHGSLSGLTSPVEGEAASGGAGQGAVGYIDLDVCNLGIATAATTQSSMSVSSALTKRPYTGTASWQDRGSCTSIRNCSATRPGDFSPRGQQSHDCCPVRTPRIELRRRGEWRGVNFDKRSRTTTAPVGLHRRYSAVARKSHSLICLRKVSRSAASNRSKGYPSTLTCWVCQVTPKKRESNSLPADQLKGRDMIGAKASFLTGTILLAAIIVASVAALGVGWLLSGVGFSEAWIEFVASITLVTVLIAVFTADSRWRNVRTEQSKKSNR